MTQIVSPLFLPPTGFTGSATVRVNTLGVFLQIMEDDLDNVFIPNGQVDFAQNMFYLHDTDRDNVLQTYSCLDDTKTILQDIGGGLGQNINDLVYVQMRTKQFKHEISRDDTAILNAKKYSIDNWEHSYGVTILYLKEFKD
jgi:hypothetical protein